MLQKYLLFNLLIIGCLSIDIKLEINDNFLQNRQFNYLFEKPISNCFLWYRIDEKENIINGQVLEENKFYLFKNVPNEIEEGEIIENNEKYKDAEFRIEFSNHTVLSKIIPSIKNQV